MSKKKIVMYTSSVTGNTRKVMDYIAEAIEDEGIIERYDTPYWMKDPIEISDVEFHIVGFWCRRGSMDDASLELMRSLKGKNVLLIGTLGNYPDSPYGKRVLENVKAEAKECNLLGCFLCQGKIEESRTEKRRSLPKDHVHYLNDEGYKRHLDSRSHPDEKDLQAAASYVKSVLHSFSA
ncbi:MAG: flavodoxin family protein [Eubacteriales bacterium]|nr:flavodoxin family protein [Eubacteriales bacterium]